MYRRNLLTTAAGLPLSLCASAEKPPNLLVIKAKSPASIARDEPYHLLEDAFKMVNLRGEQVHRAKYRRQADNRKRRLLEWLTKAHSPLGNGVKERRIA